MGMENQRIDVRKAIVTDEHKAEAAALRAIWTRVGPASQKEFGKEFEIGGQSAVANFLAGTSALSLKAAMGFAQGLNCKISDFSRRLAREAQRAAEASGIGEHDSEDFVAIRRADVAFSNGSGKVVYQEDDRPPLVFRKDFLQKLGIAPGHAVVVDGVGHSNEPKIPEGSVVLVNRGDRERLNGDFFAFRYDGELLIKRLQRLDGVGVLATAENPNFKPKSRVYTGAEMDHFEVIGRAVWKGATL